MHPIIEKLAQAGYLTREQVSRVESNAHEFLSTLQSDPGFRKVAFVKLSVTSSPVGAAVEAAQMAPGNSIRGILQRSYKPAIASMILATGAIIGEQLARKGYASVKGALTKSHDYKSMLEVHPDLAKEDSTAVQRAFNTLHKFNPVMASDPLVAGGFVRHTIDSAQFPMRSVSDLVGVRRQLADLDSPRYDIHRLVKTVEEPSSPHEEQLALWKAQAERAKKDPPPHEPHAEQVRAWKSQADRPGPDPTQIELWEVQRDKALLELQRLRERNEFDKEQMRQERKGALKHLERK